MSAHAHPVSIAPLGGAQDLARVGRYKPGRLPPPTSTSVLLPRRGSSEKWKPRAAVQLPAWSFWDTMTLEELPDDDWWRPKKIGLEHERKDGTAQGMWRKAHLIFEEMGYDLAEYRREHGAMPWDHEELPWETLRAWAGPPKHRAIRWKYRDVLRWMCSHQGLDDATMPRAIAESWRNDALWNKAIDEGLVHPRDMHFVPAEICALLGAHPFTERLRMVPQHWAREDQRETAEYKDQMCRTMVFHDAYLAYRSTEVGFPKVKNYDRREKVMRDLPQEKDKPVRNPATPEKDVFAGSKHAYPTLEFWLDEWHPCPEDPEAPLFPKPDGTPYKNVALVLGDFINMVLGADSPGPHGLRRFAATWAYYHGWSDDAVAGLLDDEWKNVKASYLNWSWLNNRDRLNTNTKNPRPPRALLRSSGNQGLYEEPKRTGTPAVPEISSEQRNGLIRIRTGDLRCVKAPS